MKIQKPRTKINKKTKSLKKRMNKSLRKKSLSNIKNKKWTFSEKLNMEIKIGKVRKRGLRDQNTRVLVILTRKSLRV
jgi:hypothetical protein